MRQITRRMAEKIKEIIKNTDKSRKHKFPSEVMKEYKVSISRNEERYNNIEKLLVERNTAIRKLEYADPANYELRKNKVHEVYEDKIIEILKPVIQAYATILTYPQDNTNAVPAAKAALGECVNDKGTNSFLFDTLNKLIVNGDVADKDLGIQFDQDEAEVNEEEIENINIDTFINHDEDEKNFIKQMERDRNKEFRNTNTIYYSDDYVDTYRGLYDRVIDERNKLQSDDFKKDVQGKDENEIGYNLRIKRDKYVLENSMVDIVNERNKLQLELNRLNGDHKASRKPEEYDILKSKIIADTYQLSMDVQRKILQRKDTEPNQLVEESEYKFEGNSGKSGKEIYDDEQKRLDKVLSDYEAEKDKFSTKLKKFAEISNEYSNEYRNQNSVSQVEDKLKAYNDFINKYYPNVEKDLVCAERAKEGEATLSYSEETLDIAFDENKRLKSKNQNSLNNYLKGNKVENKYDKAYEDAQKDFNDLKSYVDGILKHESDIVKDSGEREKQRIIDHENRLKQIEIDAENEQKEKEELLKQNDIKIQEKVNREFEQKKIEDERRQEERRRKNLNDFISGRQERQVAADVRNYGDYYRNMRDSFETHKEDYKDEFDFANQTLARTADKNEKENKALGLYIMLKKKHDERPGWFKVFRFISNFVEAYKVSQIGKQVSDRIKHRKDGIYEEFKNDGYIFREKAVKMPVREQAKISENEVSPESLDELNKNNDNPLRETEVDLEQQINI